MSSKILNLPQEGDMLGRFKLLRQVGRGGMGMVFHALDTQLHIEVALKVLCMTDTDQAVISRFKHEVLLGRRVSHPGICRIFDLHYEQGLFFITMEFCPGMTLERLLQQAGALSPWHTAQIMSSVCKAMNAANAQGVIHRDLKPGNIVVKPNYQISILDFGFSTGKDITSVTKSGAAVGTVHYVAPEVLNHLKPTAAVDIYSVGVMLYRCLTGYLPFGGDDIFAIMDAIRMGAVIPPRSVNPNVSKKMERVILKAMALYPPDRYHTFRDLRKDLIEACGSSRPKDLTIDPVAQLLEESVRDMSSALGSNSLEPDSSSSSHFDLMPEPIIDPSIYAFDDAQPNRVPKRILTLFILALLLLVILFGFITFSVVQKYTGRDFKQSVALVISDPEPTIEDINRQGMVEAKMLAKGLLIGDNPQLDQLLKKINQTEGEERSLLVKEALSIVNKVSINQLFVEEKLQKLDGYINKMQPPERAAGAREIWKQASVAASRGEYEQANLILNTIIQ